MYVLVKGKVIFAKRINAQIAPLKFKFAVNSFAPLLTINKLCACGSLSVCVRVYVSCVCVRDSGCRCVYIGIHYNKKALKASPVHRPVITISYIYEYNIYICMCVQMYPYKCTHISYITALM